MIIGSWIYIQNVELIQVSGRQISFTGWSVWSDVLVDRFCILYCRCWFDLCCDASSYCFKVYDQCGSHILKRVRFIWGSEFRKLVSWIMRLISVSQHSNTRQGQYSAFVTAVSFRGALHLNAMEYTLQGFNITAPSEFYVLCRFAKVCVIFPCEAMFDIICRYKYVDDFMNVKLEVLNLETRVADNSHAYL